MELNRRLNLVIPVEQSGGTLYVHSAPVGSLVFSKFYMVIAKTFAAIYQEGLGPIAGPRVAMHLLRDVARELKIEEEVEKGLVAEIRRLTNVLILGDRGWETTPYDEVVSRKMIDEQDVEDIENALAYFTAASSMHRRTVLTTDLDGAAKLWGALITSSNCTEYGASLKTSTAIASSGATATMSQVPR